MAVDKTYALQTKWKTCFGGPRMILQAHWKNTFPKRGLVFYYPRWPPPWFGKRPYFSRIFFSAPFPYWIVISLFRHFLKPCILCESNTHHVYSPIFSRSALFESNYIGHFELIFFLNQKINWYNITVGKSQIDATNVTLALFGQTKMQSMWLRLFWSKLLSKHLKSHSGEKSNQCNECDFTSIRANNLRHLKTHSGEK